MSFDMENSYDARLNPFAESGGLSTSKKVTNLPTPDKLPQSETHDSQRWQLRATGHENHRLLEESSKDEAGFRSDDEHDEHGRTPLSYAAEEGRIEIVEDLLGKCAASDTKDNHGRNALMWALRARNSRNVIPMSFHTQTAQAHSLKIVQLLIKDADLDTKDNSGRTAISYAAETNSIELFMELLGKGAAFDTTDDDGRTPLTYAAKTGCIEIVQALLNKGADFDIKDKSGRTAVLNAVRGLYDATNKMESSNAICSRIQRDYENVVRELLNKGADVDAKDTDGRTALSHAAQGSYPGVFNLLQKFGAKVDTVDHTGRTAFSWIASTNSKRQDWAGYNPESQNYPWIQSGETVKIVELLGGAKGAVADIADNTGRTPLSWAAEKGCTKMVEYICLINESGDSRAFRRDKQGRSALSFAAGAGKYNQKVIETLVETGQFVDDFDDQYRTPLHWFHLTDLDNQGHYTKREKRDIQSLWRMQVEEHADFWLQPPLKCLPRIPTKVGYLNRSIKNGKTLLSYAVLEDDINLVDVLCQTPNISSVVENDDDNKTALSIALEKGDDDIIQLLALIPDTKKKLQTIVKLGKPDLMGRLLTHLSSAKRMAIEIVLEEASDDAVITLLKKVFDVGKFESGELDQVLEPRESLLKAARGRVSNGMKLVQILLSNGANPNIWTTLEDWSKSFGYAGECLIKLSRKEQDPEKNSGIQISYGFEHAPYQSLAKIVLDNKETIFLAHPLHHDWEKRPYFSSTGEEYKTHEIECRFQSDENIETCDQTPIDKTPWGIRWVVKDNTQSPVIYESRLRKVWIPLSIKDFLGQFLTEFDDKWQDYCHTTEIHLNEHRRKSSGKWNTQSHINSLADDIYYLSELRSGLQRQVSVIHEELVNTFDEKDMDFRDLQNVLKKHKRCYNEQLDRYEQVVTSLLQLEYTRHSIREAEIITRMSQVTFIYLPLMFASSLFGMNIDILRDNAGWYWYLLVAAASVGITYILYQKNDWKDRFQKQGYKGSATGKAEGATV